MLSTLGGATETELQQPPRDSVCEFPARPRLKSEHGALSAKGVQDNHGSGWAAHPLGSSNLTQDYGLRWLVSRVPQALRKGVLK